MAQLQAIGLSEAEYPYSFLRLEKALGKIPYEGEVAEEEAEKEAGSGEP